MANDDSTTRSPVRQPFVLYAANGRIYARNRTQKVIDLGEITREGGGSLRYLLDGNQQSDGGFFTEEEALHAIAHCHSSIARPWPSSRWEPSRSRACSRA